MDLPFPCVKCTDMPNLGQLVVKGKGREIDSPFTGKKYGHAGPDKMKVKYGYAASRLDEL